MKTKKTRAMEPGIVVENPTKEWQGMPEFRHKDLSPYQTVHIHFKSPEDVQAFAALIGQTITDRTRYLWFPAAEIGRFAHKRYVGR